MLILVRDVVPDEDNPLTAEEVKELLELRWKDHDVKVQIIPDIVSVNYGRGVGYGVYEHSPPKSIEGISATAIRNLIKAGDDTWKNLVDESIHDVLIEKLGFLPNGESTP